MAAKAVGRARPAARVADVRRAGAGRCDAAGRLDPQRLAVRRAGRRQGQPATDHPARQRGQAALHVDNVASAVRTTARSPSSTRAAWARSSQARVHRDGRCSRLRRPASNRRACPGASERSLTTWPHRSSARVSRAVDRAVGEPRCAGVRQPTAQHPQRAAQRPRDRRVRALAPRGVQHPGRRVCGLPARR